MCHKRWGHNNFTDLSKLVEHVEEIGIRDSSVDVCEICDLNKARKQPINSKRMHNKSTSSVGHCAHRHLRAFYLQGCR